MSHSRIIVLDKIQDNIDYDDLLETMRSYGNGADYIIESHSSYESDYNWVMNFLKNLGFEETEDKRGFKVTDIPEFWTKMHDDCLKYFEKGLPWARWEITERLRMIHGFWVYSNDELLPLPYFVEFLGDKTEFKIEKFLDYHC